MFDRVARKLWSNLGNFTLVEQLMRIVVSGCPAATPGITVSPK